MKKLILAFFLLSFLQNQAQNISPGLGNPDIIIVAGGQVRQNDDLLGLILPDGTIKNTAGNTIGFISEDGVIKNASSNIVGYFTANYQVTNSSNEVIGSFTSTHEIFNASMVKIGTYDPEVKPAWSAVAYFFFQP